MTSVSKLQNLAQEALSLDSAERAELASTLIESLEDKTSLPDASVDAAWLEEADRRYDAYLRGEMQAISLEESLRRARALIG